MVVCSFLTHEILYDAKVQDRLAQAVEQVVAENDEVDFWVYILRATAGKPARFAPACYRAVSDARGRHPEKKILLTRVICHSDNPYFSIDLDRHMIDVPPCLSDRIITGPNFPDTATNLDIFRTARKTQRWIIKQSAYIITYVYESLLEPENQLLAAARKSGAVLLDITDPDTAAALTQVIHGLPDRERLILENIIAKRSVPEIAPELGLTASALRQLAKKACSGLKEWLEARREQQKAEAPPRPASCGVFALHEDAEWNWAAISQAVKYLTDICFVNQFYFLEETCPAEYQHILKEVTRSRPDIRLTAFTPLSLLEEAAPEAEEKPGADGEKAGPRLQEAIEALVSRCTYCIGMLGDSPFEQALRTYLEGQRHAIFLDLSRKYRLPDNWKDWNPFF